MRGGGINATTSHRMRDYRGGSKSNGDGNSNGECHAPPSQNLAATTLVLTAEADTALIVDEADGATAVSPSCHLQQRVSRRGVWGN